MYVAVFILITYFCVTHCDDQCPSPASYDEDREKCQFRVPSTFDEGDAKVICDVIGVKFYKSKKKHYCEFNPESCDTYYSNGGSTKFSMSDESNVKVTVQAKGCPGLTPCPCSYTFFPATGYCYKAIKSGRTWRDSENACAAEGGHLVSIHTWYENNFVRLLAGFPTRITPDPHDSGDWINQTWTGLYSPANNLKFEWSDGTAFNFGTAFKVSPWPKDQPDYPKEGCVEIRSDESIGENGPYPNYRWDVGQWNNLPCEFETMRNAVCKRRSNQANWPAWAPNPAKLPQLSNYA